MKKYFIILAFTMALFSVAKAQQFDELEYACDNAIWEEEKQLYTEYSAKNEEDISFLYAELTDVYMKYLLGDSYNKAKYKKEAISYCVNGEGWVCEWAVFPLIYFDKVPKGRILVNYPSAALVVNNKELFEALIKEYPFLIDDAIYDWENYHNNEHFYTPALLMLRNGQYGLLKYLIKNYKVNLLKNSGFIYYRKTLPQEQINAKQLAEKMIKEWTEKGDENRLKCALKTKEVVLEWYKEHENDPEYNNQELRDYNEKINKIAHDNKVENTVPLFEPIESLDMLRLNIEENYAQNIEKAIDTLMEKIINFFDLSSFGNKESKS